MLTYLITGATLGLWAGVSPGPLLTMVIAQTLRHDVGEGVKVAVAPILTDLPIIALFVALISQVPDINLFLGIVSLVGALLVAWLALAAIRQGPVAVNLDARAPRSLLKGALVNAMSPHPYIFWLTIGVPTMFKAHTISWLAVVGFVSAFFLLIIGAKVGVAVVVGRSRHFLQGATYVWCMRGIGVIMLLFALLLVRDGAKYLSMV